MLRSIPEQFLFSIIDGSLPRQAVTNLRSEARLWLDLTTLESIQEYRSEEFRPVICR